MPYNLCQAFSAFGATLLCESADGKAVITLEQLFNTSSWLMQ